MFVYRVSTDVECEHIREHLAKYNIQDKGLVCISHAESRTKSF